ncbi:MAG TPA: hypothetical protein DEQ40_19055 [Oxalobacteraceae bacterium]|jgi:hypothetical protein|nr:hypothetical protein [Oxalobacteraceae bacterium]
MTQVAITGNTYPVKDQIRALGGRWNPDTKAWMVPAAKASEAQKLVSGAPRSTASASSYRPAKCTVCGKTEKRDFRGYTIGDRILRSGECQSCYEERKMGY